MLHFPYRFGNEHLIVPPNLNDLNLPRNPFNVLATMAMNRQDQLYSHQLPEPSDPSPIFTPPMNLSSIDGWETPHTTTDDNTFYSEGEPRGSYEIILPMKLLTPLSPDKFLSFQVHPTHCCLLEEKSENWAWRCLFLNKGECQSTAARQAVSPTSKKDTLMLRKNSNSNTFNRTLT